MMKVKKSDFIARLDTTELLSFGLALSNLCFSVEMDADATELKRLCDGADEMYSKSKVNPYTESHKDLVAMMRREETSLADMLRYYSDDNEKAAYKLWKDLLKGMRHRGMYKYVKRISSFLAALGDSEFDGSVASAISTLRILVARFDSVELDKNSVKKDRKLAKKTAEFKKEIQDLVILIGAKIMVLDEKNGTSVSVDFNILLDEYRSNFLRHYADASQPDDDAQG